MPLLPASNHLQPLSQSPPSEPSRSSSASGTSQLHFLSLSPYCQAATSSQVHQKYSSEVEATVNRLVTPASAASSTYLSRGFYFHRSGVVLKGMGYFFLQLAAEKLKGRCKTSVATAPSSRTCASRPTVSASVDLEKNLTLGSARADPSLCDSRENHVLGEQVKLIKKTGDTWLCERLTLKQEPVEPRGL